MFTSALNTTFKKESLILSLEFPLLTNKMETIECDLHAVRALKQPYREAHVARNPGLLPAAM